MDILIGDLVQALVECSNKASRLAQVFRGDQEGLFRLLVEEKAPLERKGALVQDYKTLADVLVQETIRRDVGEKFPLLLPAIKGEEQNSFMNSLGQTICVELTPSEEVTAELLSKVLDGKNHLAKSVASVVHSQSSTCKRQLSAAATIPADSIGIWIDPIDATAEYIRAKPGESCEHEFQSYGLKCVCVLVGAYELKTGKPVIGVVSQPFFHKDNSESSWKYQTYWAVNYNDTRFTSPSLQHSGQLRELGQKVIVISWSESQQLQDILSKKYQVIHTAGAGYKSLLVAQRKADLWVLSQATTHLWDTCGPHSLLAAQEGGMVGFADALSQPELDGKFFEENQIVYSDEDDSPKFRNLRGVVAYIKPEDVVELFQLLRDNAYL